MRPKIFVNCHLVRRDDYVLTDVPMFHTELPCHFVEFSYCVTRGATNRLERNGLPVNWGCGNVRVNAKQLARLGHPYLNQGQWNGRQLISRKFIAQATRNQVPTSIGLIMDSRQVEGRGIYGYHWWTKGTSPTKGENLPDAPDGTFYRSGAGHNMLLVVPRWNMVIVRLGNDGSSLKQMGTWNAVFRRIGASFIQD